MNDELKKFLDCIGVLGMECLMTDRVFGSNVREKILDTATFNAWKFVDNKDPDWIRRFKKRMSSEKDGKNIEALFGEVRAYADILKFPFYDISPNSSGKGPDFTLKPKVTGEGVKIEVYTQEVKENCCQPYQEFKPSNVQETIVTPLLNWKTTLQRVPMKDVSIAKGSIRNVGGAKKDAHQVDAHIPTYLYIDFQSIWGLRVDQALPIMTQLEHFTSGVFWMAFYGKKGMPILENLSLEESVRPQIMDSDGIFFNEKSSRWAGALLRVAGNESGNPLIFFENPHSKVTPAKFIASMMLSGLYNEEVSCDSFAGTNVQSKVRRCNKRISNLYKAYQKIEATLRG